MGFFDFLKGPDINAGVADFRDTKGALLLDVRTAGEFSGGHIPGAKNIPLDKISKVEKTVMNKETPIFVYCHSGARAAQATGYLKDKGYKDVRNIGGIMRYSGTVTR